MCLWIFNDCGQFHNFTYRCFNFLQEPDNRSTDLAPDQHAAVVCDRLLSSKIAWKCCWKVFLLNVHIEGFWALPLLPRALVHHPVFFIQLLEEAFFERARESERARWVIITLLQCRCYVENMICCFPVNLNNEAVKYKSKFIKKPRDAPHFIQHEIISLMIKTRSAMEGRCLR